MPTEVQELLNHFEEERYSLRSLKRFLEKGVGIDAIRTSRVTSRRSSVGSVAAKPRTPSRRSIATAPEAEASLERRQEDRNSFSLLSILRVSRVSSRSLHVRSNSGAIAIRASNGDGLLSREEFPVDDTSRKRQSEMIERRKGNWFVTRTKCVDIKLGHPAEN